MEKSFTQRDIFYFPVRHHSPACSAHLKSVIERYKPECILIEGPEDGNHLIGYLGSEGIKPPVCIYYGYDDKNASVSGDKGRYRAYYPFLDYSPELTAIREAVKRSIPAYFIDMPYGMQLVQFGGGEKLCRFGDDNTAEYYRRTAEKSGCRSFSEFWELAFEVNGLNDTDEKFIHSVYMLGKYMRELSPADESNRYREAFMRGKIEEYRRQYGRVLVMAGAYHIGGLEEDSERLSFRRYSAGNASLYLVPYSFPEADSRSGYGAGIPFPSFYSAVWKKIIGGSGEPYSETVRAYIIGAARYARSKNEAVSLSDEIQAEYMARELAMLRGKSQPGAYELTDGVRSAFVKGDINSSASSELDYLFRTMTGLGAGEVNISGDTDLIIPPCVADFRVQCRKYRINLRTAARQEITLDIVKNTAHAEKSAFLHRMAFLGTDFARLESGPDYVNNTDTSLIREHWSVRFSTETEAKLTDLSVFGGTVGEICVNMLREKFTCAQGAGDIGRFLLNACTMGFAEGIQKLVPDCAQRLRDDSDFISQCSFMHYAARVLALLRTVYRRPDEDIERLLGISYMTALNKLESVKESAGDSAERVCSGLRMMYSLSSDYPASCPAEELLGTLKEVIGGGDVSPAIYGVGLSICMKSGKTDRREYCEAVTGYITTADAAASAELLGGIISVARDVILTSDDILEAVDSALASMKREQFLSALPHFRRAFTAFLPQETAELGGKIAGLHGADNSSLEGSLVYSAGDILHASECDRRAEKIMRKWGMLKGGEYDE